MYRIITFAGLILLWGVSLCFAQEEITITTYYSSPYGVYKQMRLYPHADIDPTTACSNKGEMYYDDSDNKLYVCDGSAWQGNRPRVIHTGDPVVGCPPARAANTDLFTQTFNLNSSTNVYITGDIIRTASGRVDLYLYVDGVLRDRTLTYTPNVQWEDAHVVWSGVLAAGNHTVSLRSPTASVWGCGSAWGAIDTILFE